MQKDKILKYNTGISILKIWMTMSIVVCHFLDTSLASGMSKIFTVWGGTGVPVLILCSFILVNITTWNNYEKLKKRIYRLFLPQCFFAVLYFIIYCLVPLPKSDVYAGGRYNKL